LSLLYPLSLHDALPICQRILSPAQRTELCSRVLDEMTFEDVKAEWQPSLVENILTLDEQMANHRVSPGSVIGHLLVEGEDVLDQDRKSTRLNSSHRTTS